MKKLNQTLLLAATAVLLAGSAYAQAPTNTYQGAPVRPLATPGAAPTAPGDVAGASKGDYSKQYSDYSQDSYVSQTGTGNYATVDQVNTSGGTRLGNTATLTQTGDNNKASQSQSASGGGQGFSGAPGNDYYTGDNRNFMRSTQNGSGSQTQQSQSSGFANRATVLQGANTTGNRAIQNQGVDGGGASVANQAIINQTKYQTTGGGSGNYAEQQQSGILQNATIDQEASNSYAKQTQRSGANGSTNDAYIHQGDPGTRNTAEQTQDGNSNTARITQSVGSNASDNFAMQSQTGTSNQADISQSSNSNYAQQMQNGDRNYSSMNQSNVSSAAYSTQMGTSNTAIITQR